MDAGPDAPTDGGTDAAPTDAGSDAPPADSGCDSTADCTDVRRSRCVDGTCEPCANDDHCMHLSDTPVCDEDGETCVDCTADTEEERCGDNSCSALTNTCTDTERESRGLCETCEADSECQAEAFGGTPRHCVALEWMGSHRGYYCLEPTDSDCDHFAMVTIDGDSINSVTGPYCAPEEGRTTCEAYRDFFIGTECTLTSETATCGDPSITDGLCRDDGEGARCTVPCDPTKTPCVCNDTAEVAYCCTGTDSSGCEVPT